MNEQATKLIAQYLAGELSEADQKIFEDRMASSEELRQEVEFQKTIVEAAKRSSIRTQVQSASKYFHFNQTIKWTGISLGIIAVVTALSILAIQQFSKENPSELSQFDSLMEQVKKEELISNLPSEFYAWNGTDTAMLSKNGILISIPESAFCLNGKPYKEPALIQFQEALDAATIVKSGLSTMSDDKLLETQGMFSFTAFSENGEKLTINPKTGIYVQVPVDEYKKDMQLFTGVEDKNGIINWVNPKPLAKIPVPVDMNDLNFYPPGYEDSLNKMKLRKDKKYRDSLYLSCEEDGIVNKPKEISEIESLFTQKCASCHQPHKDGTGPKLFDVRQKWVKGGAKAGSIYIWVNNWQKAARTDPYAQKVSGLTCIAHSDNPELSFIDIDALFDYVDRQPNYTQTNYIPPSNVLAFWKPKFNNTNLATREFEKRMQAIHGTCNNKVLEVYTKNLNKSIRELDEQVVKMGYSNFEGFVAENVGALNPNNPHIKALSEFYERAVNELQEKVKRNRDKEQQRKDKWDNKVQDERTKESNRSAQRNSKNYQEEYDLNYESALKQLGRKKPQLGKTIGVTIATTGIYNLDRFVADVTLARKTGEFFDKETGKTARIQYNAFSVEVANQEQYKQIYVYLFPSELNSYQRIAGKNGKFDYPLNDAIIYDMAIVGISEKGFSYFQKSKFKEGKLGTIILDRVSEEKLNASIEQLNNNRISKPMRINDELDWLKTEQKNYVEQRSRQNQYLFQERIKRIVFPCYAAESDSIYSVENEIPFEI